MAYDGYGRRTPTAALTRSRTVYVDSATGNDATGDGTQAKPWASLARAWVERLQYLEIRADFVIQLLGAGPYVVDFPMGGSFCAPNGRVLILGDPTYNVSDQGTATGDMVGNVVPCTAIENGGAANYQWVEFTTGNCAGCVFLVNHTQPNSFTVANSTARAANGAIANGDAFRMINPVTELQFVLASSGSPEPFYQVNDLQGSFAGGGPFTVQPCHWLHGLQVTGANLGRVSASRIGLSLVRFVATMVFHESEVLLGGAPEQSRIPGSANDRLVGAGPIFNATCNYIACRATGIVSNSSFSSYGATRMVFAGGRIGHPVAGSLFVGLGSTFEGYGGVNENRRLQCTIQVEAGVFRVSGQGVWISDVSLGSCANPRRGGQLLVQLSGAGTWTGGTSDPAGYNVDTRGGGRALFVNNTPACTGGTPGSDLITTNVAAAANAALNANGNAVGNATDALLGEVLARVP